MATSTIYDIILRYSLQDRASRGAQTIQRSTAAAAKSTGMLERGLQTAAAAGAGFFGVRAAKSALVDFNAGIDQAKIQMAGLMQLNLGGQWAGHMQEANRLVADFQQIAKSSAGTTKDFVDMAALIVRPVTAAGASMQDLRDITKGAVIAAQAFGIASDVAGRDIEEALMGNLTKVSRFGRALLEPQGWTTETFNALDANKRRDELKKALKGRAITDMANAQGKSWGGITSTLQDNLQMALGKVGLPLMQKLTDQVSQWNTWIEAHPDKIKEWTTAAGSALATGFSAMKEAVQWIAANKETLLSLAKAAVMLKGGSMLGNVAAGPFKALAGWASGIENAKKATGSLSERLTGMAGAVSAAMVALGAFAAGVSLLADRVLQKREQEIQQRANLGADVDWAAGVGSGATSAPGRKALRSRIEDALASGLLKQGKDGFSVDKKSLAVGAGRGDAWTAVARFAGMGVEYQQSQREIIASQTLLRLAIEDAANRPIDHLHGMLGDGIARQVVATTAIIDKLLAKKPASKAANVKVTIQRIEVQSDDPDRFVHGMVESFRDAVKNPSSAFDQLREG